MNQMNQMNQLLSLYNNSLTCVEFYSIVSSHLNNKIVFGWHITEDIWHIYDNGTMEHRVIYPHELTNKTYMFNKMFIDVQSIKKPCEVDKWYIAILEMCLYKMATEDLLYKTKLKHTLTINNICEIVKEPLTVILHSIKDSNAISQDVIRHSMTKLSNRVFDILDLHKLESNTLELQIETFNIHDLIMYIKQQVKSMQVHDNTTINYYIDATVPEYALADSKRIKQILISVLRNAVKHTYKGEINICIYANVILDEIEGKKPQDDQLIYMLNISIADTGTGIDDRTKNNLFKPIDIIEMPFGISMRICWLLAKRLNGELKISSQLGKGSCFTLEIPVYENHTPLPYINTLALLKGKRALIVDSSMEKITLCNCMNKYELEYTCSSTYEEVFILYINRRFDIIFINTAMKDAADIHKKAKTTWLNAKYIAMIDKNNSFNGDFNGDFDDYVYFHSDEDLYKIKIWEAFS